MRFRKFSGLRRVSALRSFLFAPSATAHRMHPRSSPPALRQPSARPDRAPVHSPGASRGFPPGQARVNARRKIRVRQIIQGHL